jgi:hypothetical protein
MTTTIPLQGGNTQLSYGLEVNDPIIADGGISMTLVASNPTSDTITFQSVALTFPEGTNATDLIVGGAAIATQTPSGWTVGVSGGTVTFTAPGGGVAMAGGELTFTIQTNANASPGSVNVLLTETAADPPGGFEQGTGTFPLTKFPVGFSLSDLSTMTNEGLEVPYGQPALLTWTATGDGVSCTLDYQAAQSGPQVSQAVPNIPPAAGFQTEALTNSGTVAFTLTAQVSVLGQDNPLVAHRQCSVTVEAMSLNVVVEPPAVGVNGLVRLTWNAPNADHCELWDGTIVPATGTKYVLLPATQTFTINAYGADGQTKQWGPATIEVNPSIVPNGTGFVIVGQPGPTGPGAVVHRAHTTEGWSIISIDPPGPGQQGQNVALSPALPPLDTTTEPALVLPIMVTGGAGGAGGAGAYWVPQGPGGPGGNAVLTATFDPSQTQPAQFIVTVAGGAGGGGSGPGAPGSASATIDGIAVALPGAAVTISAAIQSQQAEEEVMSDE